MFCRAIAYVQTSLGGLFSPSEPTPRFMHDCESIKAVSAYAEDYL
jgi:hypothetical protein